MYLLHSKATSADLGLYNTENIIGFLIISILTLDSGCVKSRELMFSQ